MNQKVLNNIKRTIREWFGLLSISEIISNPNLAKTFERIERIIQKMESNPRIGNEARTGL